MTGTPVRPGAFPGGNSLDQGEGKTAFVVEEGRRTPGGVQVHVLQGIFTDCPAAYDFLTELRAELAEPGGDVVLDVTDVAHMTSGGVGMLAALVSAARDSGRTLHVAGARSRLTAILQVTRLLPIIPVHDTLEQALRAAEPNVTDGDRE